MPSRRTGARRRMLADTRGQAVVEFALIVPVMLLLAFAIVQFGLVLNAQLGLTEGVRQGAQLAAMGDDASQVTSAVAVNAPMVENLNVTAATTQGGAWVTVQAQGSVPVIVGDLPFLGSAVTLSATQTELVQAPPGG